MKLHAKLQLNFCLLLLVSGLIGCAAKTEMNQEVSIETKKQEEPIEKEPMVDETPQVIELACKSASKLGCRHKGYIYPWNAWLDEKGYDAKDYELKEIIMKGSKATVVIMER